MRPRFAIRITPPFRRTVLALAAAVLFLMPMTYRGGAEAAHPHALLQVWVEAAHSLPDHHHAYLHHAPPTGSEEHRTAGVSPDIPRSQDGSFTVGIAPIPMLPPTNGVVPDGCREAARIVLDSPALAGVQTRPESPPPKSTA
jgi:hypothetical protein